MAEYNETEIVKQLQDEATRRKAFTSIIKEYKERLYWQIRKTVISHEDADDVLQNVFLKAWKSIESFRGESKISTWLYRIAFNESITFLNKQRQELMVSADDESVFLYDKLEADEYFDGDYLEELLQKAILTLPDKQRVVFNMRYFDEMKYEEISDVLGTSVGALKASYHIAAKKIEEYLTQHN